MLRNLAEELRAVLKVHASQIEGLAGGALPGGVELAGCLRCGRIGKVFHGSDADLRGKDDHEERIELDVLHQQAVKLALLVNTVEVRFVDHGSHALSGGERAGSQGREGSGVEPAG